MMCFTVKVRHTPSATGVQNNPTYNTQTHTFIPFPHAKELLTNSTDLNNVKRLIWSIRQQVTQAYLSLFYLLWRHPSAITSRCTSFYLIIYLMSCVTVASSTCLVICGCPLFEPNCSGISQWIDKRPLKVFDSKTIKAGPATFFVLPFSKAVNSSL